MEEDIKKKVFRQVRKCMQNLVGGSGHLGGYFISEDDFHITGTEELPGHLTQYHFNVKGELETEFTEYTEDYQPILEDLTGSIVLDQDFNLTRDEQGKIRLEPWKVYEFPEPKANSDSGSNPQSIHRNSQTSSGNGPLSQDDVDNLLKG